MRLEVELVTKGDLEDGVLAVAILKCLSKPPVVTGIQLEVSILVRNAYRDREVERLSINICRATLATCSNLVLAVHLKTRLNTKLNGQALNNVNIGKDRNVDVVELDRLCNTT